MACTSAPHVPVDDRTPIVHVLVDAATPARLAATARLFETLRIGFPTAPIAVLDNASPPAAAAQIERLASAAGCALQRAAARMPDYAFLSGVILDPAHDGRCAIVTGGVIFWASCEGWDIPALLAGRLLPAHVDGGRICRPRLNPSFWWIRDVARLRERIFRLYRGSATGFLDPFVPSLVCDEVSGVWHHYATGANLYAALRVETHAFTEPELECFDDSTDGRGGALEPPIVQDYRRLKGLWRAQDEFYRSRAVPLTAELVLGR